MLQSKLLLSGLAQPQPGRPDQRPALLPEVGNRPARSRRGPSQAHCHRWGGHALLGRLLGWQLGLWLGAIMLWVAHPVWAQTPGKSQTPQSTPTAGLATSLFDGRTLAGWTIEGDCQAAVVDGLLVLQQGNGWLRSDLMFRDFDLHVEWKAVKTADYDSGIYLRTLSGGTPFPRESYQINLLDGAEGNCKQLRETIGTKGQIRRGEWNSFDISVRKETISLSINGRPVYRVAGLKDREGHIGLQCEVEKGGQFQFRNITVTEPGFRSLFNGRDLTGWEGGGEDASLCWKVEPTDQLLVCTGAKGPWLKSTTEYGDFDLRFEYQVSGGGNSGVYVRVPADGNHHRENDTLPPAGFEVQLLDDAAPQYATLKDYQYSASVYDICGANPRVCRPAGEWNTLRLRCEGQTVQVWHNGVAVVHVTDKTHPLIALRKTSGFLGLQNHSTEVRFRNIRLAPVP